jgi:hypothetical protein
MYTRSAHAEVDAVRDRNPCSFFLATIAAETVLRIFQLSVEKLYSYRINCHESSLDELPARLGKKRAAGG